LYPREGEEELSYEQQAQREKERLDLQKIHFGKLEVDHLLLSNLY